MLGLRTIALALATLFAAAGLVGATPASAQATRTWVSGVGDDANPCSRTAPCKTFAGAISKTAAGGEINCLDAGAFGAVTITKSISIICQYTEAGVLATGGTSGIIINAAATDVIYLSGLDINGGTPTSFGANGIRILSAATVHIENTTIRNFRATNGLGISIAPAAALQVTVVNTTISDNGTGATGGGIQIQPTGAAGSARVTLRDVRLQHNANNNLRVDTTGNTGPGVSVNIDDVQFVGGANHVSVNVPAGTSNAQLMITNSFLTLGSGTAISLTGASARARVGNSTITGNGTGIAIASSASVNTYGTNRLDGNGTNGAFTLPALPQQ
jgi:hypothetical protein